MILLIDQTNKRRGLLGLGMTCLLGLNELHNSLSFLESIFLHNMYLNIQMMFYRTLQYPLFDYIITQYTLTEYIIYYSQSIHCTQTIASWFADSQQMDWFNLALRTP